MVRASLTKGFSRLFGDFSGFRFGFTPAIGDKFGGRDYSTVMHASKTVERKIKEDHSTRRCLLD
jgi:hypothetical protein